MSGGGISVDYRYLTVDCGVIEISKVGRNKLYLWKPGLKYMHTLVAD